MSSIGNVLFDFGLPRVKALFFVVPSKWQAYVSYDKSNSP